MVKYRFIKCSTPDCNGKIYIRTDDTKHYHYCKPCNLKYPLAILRIQTDYDLPIAEALIAVAKLYNFHSGEFIASVLKISRKKLVSWLHKFLGIHTWNEFKLKYWCKSSCCFIIDSNSPFFERFKNRYYLVKKLNEDYEYCTCLFHLTEYEAKTLGKDGKKDHILLKIKSHNEFMYLQKLSELKEGEKIE